MSIPRRQIPDATQPADLSADGADFGLSRAAVVVPTYKARAHIGEVLKAVPEEVGAIYVVDDACPDGSGKWAVESSDDPRVELVALSENQGVGGATVAGFRQAFADGYLAAVKVDADGQIAPALVSDIVEAMAAFDVGYCKGSRFTTPKNLVGMPRHRVFLNMILSITNKFASGYYSLTDPTNGLIGIRREAFAEIEPDRVAKRFFFESDLMHHLNLARVAAVQVPMAANYADEESNLRFGSEVFSFMWGTFKNFWRRVFLRHFVLSFSLAGIYLTIGVAFSLFAIIYGLSTWITNSAQGQMSNTGAIAIVILTALIGVNFVSTFFVFDVNDEPSPRRSQ